MAVDNVHAIIQARMSSERFPGKVLAPFRGRPLIDYVIESAVAAIGPMAVTVVTSIAESDDPLAAYLAARGTKVLRGPLDDVFGRFTQAATQIRETWLLRICGDSPMIDPRVIRFAAGATVASADVDLITNIYPNRTFPAGHSVEVFRRDLLPIWNARPLSSIQREHVTRAFYDNAADLRIGSIINEERLRSTESYAVDVLADIERVSRLPPVAFRMRFLPVGSRDEERAKSVRPRQ